MSFNERIEPLRQCIHPVFFENDDTESPCSGNGTCFLITVGSNCFAVTLKHIVKDLPPKNIVLMPQYGNPELVRFDKKYNLKCTDEEESEIEDLVLLRVAYNKSVDLPVIHIDNTENDWIQAPYNFNYMGFGYPNELRYVDSEQLVAIQHSFTAEFGGESIFHKCCVLDIVTITGPKSIDGYSGSPVFSWRKGETNIQAMNFCGVAIHGSYQSKKVHILMRGVIERAARELS